MVHYNSDRHADAAAATVAELKAMGVDVDTHQGDLNAVAEITRLVDHTVERFGHWDILVNTAGLIIRNAPADTTEDEYDRSMAINAKIPYFLMREAATKIADKGRIVNLVTTHVAVTAATSSHMPAARRRWSTSPRPSPRRSAAAESP
jgi:NAD(P)-dependent dehydrogenase (short-subunit alcohol dehydrogenase family)